MPRLVIATGNGRCGLNQSTTEIDCPIKSSSYDFGVGIQADAKQRVPREGRGANLVEVCHDYRLIMMVHSTAVHREYFVRMPISRQVVDVTGTLATPSGLLAQSVEDIGGIKIQASSAAGSVPSRMIRRNAFSLSRTAA